MLSNIYCIGKNVGWSRLIISISIGCRRICNVLANILYITFRRVMDQQLFNRDLEPPLCNKIMRPAIDSPNSLPLPMACSSM